MIAREKIARQYLVIGGLLFVLGFGAKFYLKWHLLPGSPAHSEMNAMHGTVIVFFGIVPMAFASLGYYLMPIGRDVQMAFPRLDSIGLWLFYCSAIIALAALMVPANSILIGALAVNLAFVIVCCVNFVATLIRVRTVSWWQMRSLVWALFALSLFLFVDCFLLEVAVLMQLKANLFGTAVWLPSSIPPDSSDPRWWWHLFWFLGHPEVVILFLLSLGLVADALRFVGRRHRIGL